MPADAGHNKSKEGIDRIISHYIQDRVKATWQIPGIEKRQVIRGLLQGQINTENCGFFALNAEQYMKQLEGYVVSVPRQKSSTKYEV